MKKIVIKTFEEMKNYFSFDEYVIKRFKTTYSDPVKVKQAAKEIAELRTLGYLVKNKSARLQKTMKNFNPQQMRRMKLHKVGDKFTTADLIKKTGGITKKTIKRWIFLGYITETKADTYEKTLIWYLSQNILAPARFKKKIITASVVTAGSSFVVTSIAGAKVKSTRTIKDVFKESTSFVLKGSKSNLKKAVKEADTMAKSKPAVVFTPEYLTIKRYERLVIKNIK